MQLSAKTYDMVQDIPLSLKSNSWLLIHLLPKCCSILTGHLS